MLVLDEHLLEAPARVGARSNRGFRYNLTREKNGYYVTLEMPNRELAKRLALNPESPDARVTVNFLPAEHAEAAGLEAARYVIIRAGGEVTLKKRGSATSNVRLGTYEISEQVAGKARVEFSKDLDPKEIQVGSENTASKALMFRLPDWMTHEEEGDED